MLARSKVFLPAPSLEHLSGAVCVCHVRRGRAANSQLSVLFCFKI